MAKDDLEAFKGILSERQLEWLRQDKRREQEESEHEVRIKTADGHEATLPFAQARNWLKRVGILVDDEDPGETEPEEPEPDEETKEPDKTVRFGRRTG